MTCKYYYVSAGAVCDAATTIFVLTLGISAQSRRDHEFLRSYAIKHGHYFEKVSAESDIFISNLRDSLAEFDIKPAYIDGHSLVKLFRQGCAEPLDQSHLLAKNYQLKMLDTSYRIISNLNRRAACSAKRSTSKT